MRVVHVRPGSRADRAGIRSGDELTSIGSLETSDALDVAFALGWLERRAPWRFVREGRLLDVELPLRDPAECGIEFEPDRPRTCPNNCVFCFVDQLPAGMRESLYVKDEDFRLSFTCGNYITLTNLDERAYRRIERQKLSPLYVSIHATDDDVRRTLLGNPRAPSIMPSLRRLADAGITLHGQIVVCPGLNDGEVIERTLADLATLGDAVATVAVVPVGLTAHRDGLFPLTPVDREGALAILRAVEKAGGAEGSGPSIHASDEVYLLAGEDLPPYEHYGEFEQIENGVGLLRLFERDLEASAPALAGRLTEPVNVVLLTGELAAPFIADVAPRELRKHAPVELDVVPVENRLLGRSVTVAGLLSGADLVRGLSQAPEAGLYLLPGEAFNADGVTLDGMTVAEIAQAGGRRPVEASVDLVRAILAAANGEGDAS
ncbi:MAG: DUF512 domain-containing protein [Candidatus Eisenbacteria bacterium]|nr:DUF512 domain-containing protein [Candidatus Eisenbacteria bacterium]